MRRGIALLALALLVPTACGEVNDPSIAGAYDGASPSSTTSPGSTTSPSSTTSPGGTTTAGGRSLRPLGEPIDVGGLRVTVRVRGAGGDKDGPWLDVTMRVENRADKPLALPSLGLHCSWSRTEGYMVSEATSVRPGRSTKVKTSLRVTRRDEAEDEYYDPIGPCAGTASISVSVSSGRPDYLMSEADGWRLDQRTLDALNARLPFTRPGGEPKDPDRAYAWVDGDGALSSGYQVVVVPGITADQAIGVLKPVRGAPEPDDFERVVIADHGDGVVLFTWALVSDKDVTALSRIKGLAATYGNTVNGDDRILVVRQGKVVRDFDPFLDHDYVKTAPLPQEKDLDLEYDTGPASWTLLERLTGIRIAEDWLLDGDHPGFVLNAE